jgi:flagellar biosynthesis protein FliR
VAVAASALVTAAVATLGATLVAPAAQTLATEALAVQVTILAREAALGCALGLTAAVPLVAGEVVGAWVARAIGDDDGASPWASATGMLGALVFFALGGHRAVVAAVMSSYRVLGPAAPDVGPATLVHAGAALVGVAVALAVPVLGAVTIAALALGAVDRVGALPASLAPAAAWRRAAALLGLAAMIYAIAHGVAAVTHDLPARLAAIRG